LISTPNWKVTEDEGVGVSYTPPESLVRFAPNIF
jgi:hypothetical protein